MRRKRTVTDREIVAALATTGGNGTKAELYPQDDGQWKLEVYHGVVCDPSTIIHEATMSEGRALMLLDLAEARRVRHSKRNV